MTVICDSYGIELVHPTREGRSDTQIGKTRLARPDWQERQEQPSLDRRCQARPGAQPVGTGGGLVVDGDTDTANVSDQVFHPLIQKFDEQMIVFTDSGFHATEGDPENMKVCRRGTWNDRMTVETVLSMLHGTCCLKKMTHRLWEHLKARLAFALAAFNICVPWQGLPLDEEGRVHLSMAQFSL